MTSLAGGRTGIPVPLTGFVVAEDQTLPARLHRSYRAGRSRAEVIMARVQASARQVAALIPRKSAFERLATTMTLRWNSATRRLDPALQSALGPLHRPLKAGWQALSRLVAPLAPALGDALATLRSLTVGACRLIWQAPRPVKAGFLMLSIIPAGWAMLRHPVDEAAPAFALLMPAADLNRPVDPWRYIASPLPAYNLEGPELGRNPPLYRVRANATGGRQDILIWGEAGVRPLAARTSVAGGIVIERRGGVSPSDSLFVETARRTALVGASIGRMAQSLELETKFGLTEIAETELEVFGASHACQSFRVAGGPGALRINGWFCGTSGRSVSRDTLGCLIDRIDLMSAGNDRDLRAWFAASERSRKACGSTRAVSVKRGSEPVFARPAERGMPELRLKLADG